MSQLNSVKVYSLLVKRYFYFRSERERLEWGLEMIEVFLLRIKVVGYIMFVLVFFSVGFIYKDIQIKNTIQY